MTQKTREQIGSDIASEWPDNTEGEITPAKLREVVVNLADSASWHDEANVTGTSETTDGHAVVFDGSSGKSLKSGGAAPVLEGDARLTDARTPTSHDHTLADISDAGGAAELDVGTTAGTVAAGDHDHGGVYQPADADLTAIAGLTSAADKLPYYTGAGAAALADLTAAARELLNDSTALAMLVTLGAEAAYVRRVVHGDTAGTARPSGAAFVEWVGSVEPENATDNDTWLNTSEP